jgi:hypothetical protein
MTNPMEFFSQNVDAWGAAEWFDRLAKAIREQDKAVGDEDFIRMETFKMIAASSAMALVRDHEQAVRSALTNTSGDGEAPVAWMLNGNATANYANVRFAEEVCGAKYTPLYARPQSAAVRDEDAEPADPWLSIDSAPKDGTRIVGWGNGEARVTTHERYRKGSIGYAQGRQDTWWEYIERETCFHWEPTHWIPLPSAPALRETKEV